jgi:hypothetical protein
MRRFSTRGHFPAQAGDTFPIEFRPGSRLHQEAFLRLKMKTVAGKSAFGLEILIFCGIFVV